MYKCLRRLVIAFSLLSAVVNAEDVFVSDNQVIENIHKMTHDRHFEFRDINSEYYRIGCDGRRMVSIAKKMYGKYNDEIHRSLALSIVMNYGETNDYDYIEACAGDRYAGAYVCKAFMANEWLTDRTLRCMEKYWAAIGIDCERNDRENKNSVYSRLRYGLENKETDDEVKKKLVDLLNRNFTNDVKTVLWTGYCLGAIDPKFKKSKRKLAMLEYALGILPEKGNEYRIPMIKEEIAELQALPNLEE